ncbi:MAG: acetylglutamate kinase [Candidatus Latescibacteria bacterium]|nr:acetylglutamate kinase [Candidatus Latescibacterota bacterium]
MLCGSTRTSSSSRKVILRMPRPFDQLDARDRTWVMSELREILREPDPEKAEGRRKQLVEKLRADHPTVAAWIADGDEASEKPERHPALESLDVDPGRANALRGRMVLVKYGGNAMIDEARKHGVIADICALKSLGIVPVIVHGGGPAISELLDEVGMETPFIGGHRKTDRAAMGYVEMVLSGKVNSEIVKLIGCHGYRAVGISGKDGGLVTARKRIHLVREGDRVRRSDLGQVGDVVSVDTHLVETLVSGGYIPVIAPIGVGADLEDYNINADMFAGHVAAALDAAALVLLTDVDGVFLNLDDPKTLIPEFSPRAARDEIGRIVQGGMIPKIEACLVAVEGGVGAARIVNGMTDHSLLAALLTEAKIGTTIRERHE